MKRLPNRRRRRWFQSLCFAANSWLLRFVLFVALVDAEARRETDGGGRVPRRSHAMYGTSMYLVQ
jgi:hypothetical protein